MANFFYRNSVVRVSATLLDMNNNPIGVSTSNVFFYLRYPNNVIHTNDPNISIKNSNSVFENLIINQPSTGVYYVDYSFTQVGNYKYKFQVYSIGTSEIISAISGDISILDDGIF